MNEPAIGLLLSIALLPVSVVAQSNEPKTSACGVEFSLHKNYTMADTYEEPDVLCAITIYDVVWDQKTAEESQRYRTGYILTQWDLTPEKAAKKAMFERRDRNAQPVTDGSFISESQAKEWRTSASAKSSGVGVSFVHGENWVGYCANDAAGLPGGGAGDYVRAILFSQGHKPVTVEGPGWCDRLFSIVKDITFINSQQQESPS